jgi:hypothetical protein
MADTPLRKGMSHSVANSGSRFGSLVAFLKTCLGKALVQPTALFEIRNIRTGNSAYAPFNDGTLADRTARNLGPDWRVFRRNAEASEAKESFQASNVNSHPSLQNSSPSRHQETTTQDLAALCAALQNPQSAIPPQPSYPSPLSRTIRLERGQLTVTFANAGQLQETLAQLSRSLVSNPYALERDSAIAEASIELQHR